MKSILPILTLTLITSALQAAEKDVWYNAKGKAVKVTPVQKEKEPFVPLWKKRELAREASQAARRENRVRNSANRNHFVYPSYGSFGYGSHFGHGGCYSYPSYGGHYHRYQSRPHWRFSGAYRGKGWSVRLRY
ncbi:MAG: hypothetical protein AB8F34_03785 [Akkermansiaceae bacterium]